MREEVAQRYKKMSHTQKIVDKHSEGTNGALASILDSPITRACPLWVVSERLLLTREATSTDNFVRSSLRQFVSTASTQSPNRLSEHLFLR